MTTVMIEASCILKDRSGTLNAKTDSYPARRAMEHPPIVRTPGFS